MTADLHPNDAGAPLFENADWVVYADGIEHKANGYFIARPQIGDRRPDGPLFWPAHMAEKSWVGASFAAAFEAALRLFGFAGLDAVAVTGRQVRAAPPGEARALGSAAHAVVAASRAAARRSAPLFSPAPAVPRGRPDRRLETARPHRPGANVQPTGTVLARREGAAFPART